MSSPQKSTDGKTIDAGWVIDGRGGAVQEDVRLRIQDGLIATIDASDPNREERSEVLDLSGYTILPCLVDSHVHFKWPAGPGIVRVATAS